MGTLMADPEYTAFENGQRIREWARRTVAARNEAPRESQQAAAPAAISLPARDVPDSAIYERGRFGLLRAVPTVNTAMRKLLDGETSERVCEAVSE